MKDQSMQGFFVDWNGQVRMTKPHDGYSFQMHENTLWVVDSQGFVAFEATLYKSLKQIEDVVGYNVEIYKPFNEYKE